MEAELAHRATHDPLTDLPNRTRLLEQLEVAAEVLAEWCVAFDFSPEEIHPHRAFRITDCPGMVDILAMRRKVAGILADG